ncbi:PAAR domain-containing protein [Yersinia pseudotuberculosis]|uniref:PAAR domain-containing protein n=1 Tax=Yersinia pseudotuberculosis TaxID=633 RepID=A0ABM7AI65_YERPU|nr:PAAR domain-containing protein [Yersinia pseudotuberculosis]AXY34730.1 PAAR domain-containing protein [Yersinia pseudotuberculosis]AYW92042.1 PAAR domain-containing protein [Yersinia pseudotuberculosis]AYX10333.1 PAAR domain-containing protein [Yersinia pseudotuberculosis]MBO1568022.1 PAAR domain-containing protein [Yersinia pseudotuberculosis]MBO1604851.1 PAAR domain-containing protein [Yersinia pseudotuberculosis]
MKGIIRIGDKTTHGGQVLGGSSNMKFGGIGVARVGDKVSCPMEKHGPTTIVEGHPTFKDNGVAVAFHGHRCACGCTLITSLGNATAS